MYFGKDLNAFIAIALILAVIGTTFGFWKIIELIIWLFSHIKIV